MIYSIGIPKKNQMSDRKTQEYGTKDSVGHQHFWYRSTAVGSFRRDTGWVGYGGLGMAGNCWETMEKPQSHGIIGLRNHDISLGKLWESP